MNIGRSLLFFLIGFLIGAAAVTIADRLYEGGWSGGPTIVLLSLPTSGVYLLVLLAIVALRPSVATSIGLAVAGFFCASFPFFCGFFPIYFMHLATGVVLGGAQLGLMFGVIVIAALVTKGTRGLTKG